MPSGEDFQILLIERSAEPFQGCYALPGGFMDIRESLEEAARRELKEETGLERVRLTQVHTFSEPDRDPRGRVISTCFAGILPPGREQACRAGSDASRLAWFPLSQLPELAFDHKQIIEMAADGYLQQGGQER